MTTPQQLVTHLQTYGLSEGRRFSPKVDLDFYTSNYPDLAAAFGNNKPQAFEHLQHYGVAEGRLFLPQIRDILLEAPKPVESEVEVTEPEPNQNPVAEDDSDYLPFNWPNLVGEVQKPNLPSSVPLSPVAATPENQQTASAGDNFGEIEDDVERETAASGDTFGEIEDDVEPETATSGNTTPEIDNQVNEGTATPPDDVDESAPKLNPTVTAPQTLMGLEEEPTPPLDLPENAGGANSKNNPAPKHLQLDSTQDEYYQGGTVRLNGWVFDASGASDVDRVEFSLHKTGEQWQEIENWTTFNISSQDSRWAYFDYSTVGLEPGKYQIKGVAYDSEGGQSNAAVAQFSVSEENPLPLLGVIDTGFNANNGDIDYKRATLGRDFVDGDDNPLLADGESSEHGTHVLGIIGATQNNGVGIYGMNDQAPLWLSRAVGSGQWADALMEFVDYAKQSGQPNAIANLSLDLTQVESDGSVKTRYEFTPREREALEYARQNGVLLVVAAGNDGSVMSVLGQASQEFDNIITVGATNGNQRADYSSYGRRGPDIMAEGGSISDPVLSTAGDNVGTMAGTSIATAQVTGAASLVWEANPGLNYRQIIEALKSTATDLNVAGEDSETGAGLVNPDGAVAKAKEMTPETYAPEAFLTPDTWGGEGLVTPEERAAEAFEHNGTWYDWELYTVQEGDNLSVIAQARTGDANDYWLIVNYPDNDIPNPDLIHPGEQYWVPVEVSAPTTEPEPTQDEGDNPTSSGDSLIVYDENGYILEIGGGSTGFGGSGTTNSEPTGVVELNPPSTASEISSVAQQYNLGNPTSDVTQYSTDITYQTFENGSVVSSSHGTYPLYGGIRAQYLKTGGLNGYLGAPTSAEIGRGDGTIIQDFENGHIYWNGSMATDYAEGDGTSLATVPDNEPNPSDKGGLIRTGGVETVDLTGLQKLLYGENVSTTVISDHNTEYDQKYWPMIESLYPNHIHVGYDIAAGGKDYGMHPNIYSPVNGTVINVVSPGLVLLDNKTTNVTFRFLHLDSVAVSINENVNIGDIIGTEGMRLGKATGDHLHFDAWYGRQDNVNDYPQSWESIDPLEAVNWANQSGKGAKVASKISNKGTLIR
ncbi:MAG: hypothetical protein Fur0025_41010 [Oscillatoriaceae cyanobacterium]